jgi:hydrogenase maturation protease
VLQADDGAGIHVIHELQRRQDAGRLEAHDEVVLRDGGTIGLSLLAEIEDCRALIAVDAMELGAEPGTIAVFEDMDIMAQLGGTKRSAHEVALADLFGAAELTGCLPERRALVGIQPGRIDWGVEAEGPVSAAIAPACDAVTGLIGKWAVHA